MEDRLSKQKCSHCSNKRRTQNTEVVISDDKVLILDLVDEVGLKDTGCTKTRLLVVGGDGGEGTKRAHQQKHRDNEIGILSSRSESQETSTRGQVRVSFS